MRTSRLFDGASSATGSTALRRATLPSYSGIGRRGHPPVAPISTDSIWSVTATRLLIRAPAFGAAVQPRCRGGRHGGCQGGWTKWGWGGQAAVSYRPSCASAVHDEEYGDIDWPQVNDAAWTSGVLHVGGVGDVQAGACAASAHRRAATVAAARADGAVWEDQHDVPGRGRRGGSHRGSATTDGLVRDITTAVDATTEAAPHHLLKHPHRTLPAGLCHLSLPPRMGLHLTRRWLVCPRQMHRHLRALL